MSPDRRHDTPPAGAKVAVVFHEPVLGGATNSVVRLVPHLEELGWRFAFWVPRPSALFDELASRSHDVDGDRRYIEYSLGSWMLPPGPRRRAAGVLPYLRHFREFVRSRSPTLVHANSILTLAEALAAKRLGPAVLLHVHEMVPSSLRGTLLRRAAWSRLDQVVAVSNASASALAHRGRLPRIVYEGTPVPAEPLPVRAEPRPFVVGTVAVISTRKGSDLFVEAARRVMQRTDAVRFEMVGAPNDALERDWAAGILERARALSIDHRARADVFERFRHWDAFVLPSRADPFPISMLEAMAAGLPVIGARRDGIAEQIAEGCGVLVEPDDAEALADAIEWLAGQSQDRRASMAAAARERVAGSFTVSHQAAAMHDAYLAALASAGGSRPPVQPG